MSSWVIPKFTGNMESIKDDLSQLIYTFQNLSRHTNSNHFPNTSLIIVTCEQFLTNPPPHSSTLKV